MAAAADAVAILQEFLKLLQSGDVGAKRLNQLRLLGVLSTPQFTQGAKVIPPKI